MSVAVPLPELAAELSAASGRWSFGYLLTVTDDARPHLLALRPTVTDRGGTAVLTFDVGGGRAGTNAAARPEITVVFPPTDGGMSLVVDGSATISDGRLELTATSAVLHRAAP